MLIGVVKAGIDQIVKLDRQISTVIDTTLLIARAVMAVLYSWVIHSLKKDDEPDAPSKEEIDELVTEKIDAALTGTLEQTKQEMIARLEANLSQYLSKHLTELDRKQAGAMTHLKEEQETVITEAVASVVETTARKRATVPETIQNRVSVLLLYHFMCKLHSKRIECQHLVLNDFPFSCLSSEFHRSIRSGQEPCSITAIRRSLLHSKSDGLAHLAATLIGHSEGKGIRSFAGIAVQAGQYKAFAERVVVHLDR